MKYFLKKLVPFILYCKTKGIELEKQFNPEIKRDMCIMDLALKEIEKGFLNGSSK
ncbi:hypothetical protein L3L50_001807 [Campylobacter coli]|nr:hypothetical protein [Campylobacter coli]